jgi:GNAT superfamily N-acetyltransferase
MSLLQMASTSHQIAKDIMTALTTTPSYHALNANATSDELQPLVDLNNLIFKNSTDVSDSASHHGSLAEWQKRLNDPFSTLVYATLPSTGANPVGFIFAHPKQHARAFDPTLHIWLAGVLPASRGTGMFHGMMKQVEDHAREKGIKTLSVATFPAKFEKMYSILTKTGWDGEQDLGDGKVLLIKVLS